MLIGMMLVRNEAGRYLEKVLEQMKSVCDSVVIVDDASNDGTPHICSDILGQKLTRMHMHCASKWETNELELRKELWESTVEKCCKDGDWILCLDADETIDNIKKLPELINQVEAISPRFDSLAFPLFDMWSPTHYRDDDLWNAHHRNWIMLVKYSQDKEYIWREQPLHCGRFPINAGEYTAITQLRIQHWGWAKPEDRQAKYERYMRSDPEGKSGSMAQYQSILDQNPCLKEFLL